MKNEDILTLQTTKKLFENEETVTRFHDIIGNRANGFITSVLTCVADTKQLTQADPKTILTAAYTAVSLDLPITKSLGLAFIIPYSARQPDGSYTYVAQFQIGYKGLIQLCQRTGQYETINVTQVLEGEIKSNDRLSGTISFEWLEGEQRASAKVIGYVAYFKLSNGFSKMLYMTVQQLQAHAMKYSTSYASNNRGMWKDNFDAMATKTVLKLLLGRYGPLTVELNLARQADQSVQYEEGQFTYVDNGSTRVNIAEADKVEELKRINEHIDKSIDIANLQRIEDHLVKSEKDTPTILKRIEEKKATIIDKATV